MLVHGPRQSGKTTFVREFGEARGYTYTSFDNDFSPRNVGRLGQEMAPMLVAGGYPEALARSPKRAAAFLRAHAETQIQRDTKDLAQICSLGISPNLLRQVSAYTAQLGNVSRVAADIAVSRGTVNEHLVLLENIFVIERLRAWSKSEAKRLSKAPKFHISDTGMGAALLEVTAEATVSQKDFNGLRRLREAAGESFTSGVVLYDGTTGFRHDESLWALPIRTLWDGDE